MPKGYNQCNQHQDHENIVNLNQQSGLSVPVVGQDIHRVPNKLLRARNFLQLQTGSY